VDGEEGNGANGNPNRRGHNGLRGNKCRKKRNNETLFELAVFQSVIDARDVHLRELAVKDAR
jgi:hypothetical protein